MKKYFCFICIIFALSLWITGCSKRNKEIIKNNLEEIKENSKTDKRGEKIEITNEFIDSIRKEIDNTKIDTPRKLLLKLFLLDNDKKYDEMEKYVYGIEYMNLFNTNQRIIDGIRNKVAVGNFSYNPIGCLFHAKYVDKLSKKGDMELIKNHILSQGIQNYDKKLNDSINKSPNDIIMYELEFTVLGFINTEQGLKLFYTKDLSDFDINLENYGLK